MTRTYDFIFQAKKDKLFMNEILHIIENSETKEICTEILKLKFDGLNNNVFVEALSKDSPFSNKVNPMTIPYKDLLEMLKN